MSNRRRCIAAALVLALVSACGSTVQVQGTATRNGGATDGLGSSTDGGLPASGTTGGTANGSTSTNGGSASGVPVSASPGPLGTSPAGGTTTGGATAGRGPESGRGFTKTTINIGVGTANDSGAAANSFGLKGVTPEGDPNVVLQAAADDINRHGGLLGRRVVLVKHDYNTVQLLTDTARANQAACTAWTQDKPVAAVLFAAFLVEDTLLACLAKANTPLIYPGASQDYPLHYQQSYAKYPLFFNLAQMVGERYDRISVDRLVARSFFEPWDTRTGKKGTAAIQSKVGVIGFSDRDGAIQEASRLKELARHGLKVGSTIRCPRSLTDKISCEQSAVLRFAASGVTHVFGADTIFMNNAQSQGYHPRYFLHVSTAAFAANEGANQLNGAMGEGYIPYADVDTSEYPGDPSPAAAACRALMKSVGQTSTDAATLLIQMEVCEEFNFLRAAVARSGSLASSGVRAGLEALGSSQPSALTWNSFLGPREHTSTSTLRDLTYRSDIGRFVYASRNNYGES